MTEQSNSERAHVLRLVKLDKKALAEPAYRYSYEAHDEVRGCVTARCDVYRNTLLAGLAITDDADRRWALKPSRKVAPTRWTLAAPDGDRACELRLPGLVVAMNPFARTHLHVTDRRSGRAYRFRDLQSGLGDMIFRSSASEWSITEGAAVAATVKRLPRKDDGDEPPRKGLLAGLKRFMKGSDWALITPGDAPLLGAPAFVALMLVHEETTNESA